MNSGSHFLQNNARFVGNFRFFLFKRSMALRDIEAITADYRKAWRGFARHQHVEMLRQTNDILDFAVTKCVFARGLTELGLGNVAEAMCEADRVFWTRLLSGSGIHFVKTDKTLACGGSCCRSTFTAR